MKKLITTILLLYALCPEITEASCARTVSTNPLVCLDCSYGSSTKTLNLLDRKCVDTCPDGSFLFDKGC